MQEDFQAVVERIVAGCWSEADLRAIASAIQAGQVVLATGERAIAISGDTNDSVNVTGSHNQVIVVKGVEAEAILRLLRQSSTGQAILTNELVQQVRSRASTKILNSFSKIRLLNKRQIEVDRLYVDVYVLEVRDVRATIPGLLEGQDTREQFDRLGLGKRGDRLQGLAIAASNDYPRLMVLGKPGSGKSTFLRHLAVSCAKGEFLSNYIPVLLELRDVDKATFNLFEWIHEELELEQETLTKQLLEQGKVLISLDGLDEVPGSLQQTVQTELRKFTKRYDKNRFILTCRTQTTDCIPEQFQALEVADFNPEQVECFALNWFRAMAETLEQGEAMKNHFMEKLQESPQTAELAVTPVLLSLTCWIFDDLKCLPQKRSELYRDGLDLLLQQWDGGRGISRDSGSDRYRQLTTEERKQLLSYLAVRKFEQPENFVLFEEAEVCGYIAEHLQISVGESREVLRAIAQQHGLLVERAHGIWSFSHLTFQEYLIAKWFYDNRNFEQLVENITIYYWRETFLLLAEMLPNTDVLFQLMKNQADNILRDNNKLQQLMICIYQEAEVVEVPYQKSAVRAFYFEQELEYAYAVIGVHIVRYQMLLSDLSPSFKNYQFRPDQYLKDFFNFKFTPNLNFDFLPNLLFDMELEQDLKKLKALLPKPPVSNQDLILNYSQWLELLKNTIIKHYNKHNFVHDWMFTNQQRELLKLYHHANSLLTQCLNSNCAFSIGVKQDIEENLLLPIVEIEKRKKSSD